MNKGIKRVVILGKPGGGKSTLAEQVGHVLGVSPLPLDMIEFNRDGSRRSEDDFEHAHQQAISHDAWVIEGLGSINCLWQRIEAADMVIYVDLPYWRHYWWVTKRWLLSIVIHPKGWPRGSSVWQGTRLSWKYLRLSPKFWTPSFYYQLQSHCRDKPLHRIQKVSQLNQFVDRHLS